MKHALTEPNRTEPNRTKILLITVIMLVLLCAVGYCGYRLIRHEQKQNEQIANLQGQIDEANARLKSSRTDAETQKFLSSCDDDHYNILFIGNSITLHDYADYWWSDKRGMASTSIDKDYVHQTVKGLETFDYSSITDGKPINYKAVLFKTWETLAHDRAESYDIIDNLLNDKLNIVVVQLGENVSDLSTYESDYKALLQHIENSAPNAKIYTIGDFWKDEDKDNIKIKVAGELDIPHVDLSPIQDDVSYEAGIGTEVEGDDGQMHKIEHNGVAMHPGDKGMQWIAEALLKSIKDNKK